MPDLVFEICHCLDLLCREIKTETSVDATTKKNPLQCGFQKNVHATFQRIVMYPNLKLLIHQYFPLCDIDSCRSCNHSSFLQICLVLLKLLRECFKKDINQANNNEVIKDPNCFLSISQQKIVSRSHQFAVALGILPNLLPGIGIPLNKRLQNAKVLEHFTSPDTSYERHLKLVVTLDTFLKSLDCETLQGNIFASHATDILAALLQLCHAPIKKIAEKNVSEERNNQNLNFEHLLACFKVEYQISDFQLVQMMHCHRSYFSNELTRFCSKVSPSLLMWDLLLFQGIPISSEKCDIEISKTPIWLRKICNKMFTTKLLESKGLISLIQIMMDKSFDVDIQDGKVDNSRLSAVARIISYNPVQHIALSDYFELLSKQILQMLHSEKSQIDYILKYIASDFIFQLCERNLKFAEEYYLKILLHSLEQCVSSQGLCENSSVIEDMITSCIEDLHQIFVIHSSPLSRKYMKLIYPFSHCICSIHFFFLEGESFLKSKVKELVYAIFRYVSEESSLSLLKLLTFPGRTSYEILTTKVDFIYGAKGGISAVQKSFNKQNEIIPYKAILDILSQIHNKDLNRMYFLFILKEYHSCQLDDPQKIQLEYLFRILQERSEWEDLGDILKSDISEVVSTLIAMLDSIHNSTKNLQLSEEIASTVILCLNSMLNSSDQLSKNDKNMMKSILPYLQKLQSSNINPLLKEILFGLVAQIGTHGVIGKNSLDTLVKLKSFDINQCSEEHNDKLSQFEKAMQDINSPFIPIKVGGLIFLGQLIRNKDKEVLNDIRSILKILQDNLIHEDSCVYSSAIKNLFYLASVDLELVLTTVLDSFMNRNDNFEVTLKYGEALMNICKGLGEYIYKYKDQLIHACLIGARHEVASIRMSSISNLGEICTHLNFNIHSHLQEIISCVLSLLQSDTDIEVRRSSAMAIYLLLKGMKNNLLEVLGADINRVYKQLRAVYETENDEKLRLQSQLALEEIKHFLRDTLHPQLSFTKEIRILH